MCLKWNQSSSFRIGLIFLFPIASHWIMCFSSIWGQILVAILGSPSFSLPHTHTSIIHIDDSFCTKWQQTRTLSFDPIFRAAPYCNCYWFHLTNKEMSFSAVSSWSLISEAEIFNPGLVDYRILSILHHWSFAHLCLFIFHELTLSQTCISSCSNSR